MREARLPQSDFFRPGRLIGVLAAGAALMLVVGVVFSYATVSLPAGDSTSRLFRGVAGLLYADGEANLWAWSSALLLAGLALVFAVKALTVREASPLPFFALAVVALGMSADEAAMLHERLARANLGVGWTFSWLALGIPLALGVGLVVLRLARGIDPMLRRRLILAGFVFLLGAIGVETLGGAVAMSEQTSAVSPQASLLYHLAVAVEEGLEVAGTLMALGATLSTLDLRVDRRELVVRSGTEGAEGAR